MFWEVGLLVTTLAAAISTSIGDEPPGGGSGIDATGAIINISDPFGALDTNGVIINETELITISDEDMDFYNENSIEEQKVCKPSTSCTHFGGYCIKVRTKCDGTVDRKTHKCGKKCKCCKPEVCKPTTSCTRAGGSCIKGRAKCDGTVDPKGCKGGKKCKCCIPENIHTNITEYACEHGADLNIACPAGYVINVSYANYGRTSNDICNDQGIQYNHIDNCRSETSLQVVTDRCGAKRICNLAASNGNFGDPCAMVFKYLEVHYTCEPVTSTTIPTTTTPLTTPLTGSTVDPCPSWITVGSDRFVRLPHQPRTNWFAAQKLCENKCGLDLYEPNNSQKVAVYLELNFRSTFKYWVGARGNGGSQVWLSGVSVPRNAPWFKNYYTRVGTEYCMEIMTHNGFAGKGKVLAPFPCTNTGTNNGVLCG